MIDLCKTTIAAAAFATLATAGSANASTFFFNASQTYRSTSDSPFVQQGMTTGTFLMENFEDGALNTPFVTANRGFVKNPGLNTDSVDADDGSMNMSGQQGHSYKVNNTSVTFTFSPTTHGDFMPTFAGLVLTDARRNSIIKFKAWDTQGNYLGRIKYQLVGNSIANGTAAGDRFFGIQNASGLSKIKIVSSKARFEIDHLQFGYAFAVMPAPAPIALGLAGLLGVGLLRRRMIRSA